jgi:glutamyl-tRNA reductase
VIVVVGLSHKTAPITIREQASVPADAAATWLRELAEHAGVREVLIVSTCNRVEIVAVPEGREEPGPELVANALVARLEAHAPGIRSHLYTFTADAAVRHLFRVGASLDSLVLGEPQILGQLKDAIALARDAGTLGPTLNRASTHALRAAKRVRSETQIGAGQVSVPSVAVDLARQVFGDLSSRTAVLIGSGEMAENVARLTSKDGARLVIVGRNVERVAELASEFGAQGRPWGELRDALVEADVVITSTSAPGFVISKELVNGLRRARRGRSLFFIDLAVPRDVDPGVADLDGVFCYNVDDFASVVEESRSSRAREADRAEAIVEEELQAFRRWLDGASVTPVLVALRRRFEAVLHEELARSLRTRLKHLGPAEREALTVMLDASVKKLCHDPTVKLKELAAEHPEAPESAAELSALLAELFALDARGCTESARFTVDDTGTPRAAAEPSDGAAEDRGALR